MAHPASGRIKNASLLLCALALLFMIAAPSMARAQSVKELEGALKSCQADWDRLNERIRQNCGHVATSDKACDSIDALAEMKKRERERLVNTPVKRPSEAEIRSKAWWCSHERDNYRDCSAAQAGERNINLGCDVHISRAEQCERELSVLQGPGPYPRDPRIAELDAEIIKLEGQYSACLQAASKRDECLRLQGQLKSVAAACEEIKGKLQAASGGRPQQETDGGRPEPQTYGGTLHTFIVRCNATEVKPGDIVSCTANGIYSSNLNTELDLTKDPATQWQNGPRVSTTNLRPGQTFRVTATRSGFTEGVTITVVSGQQEQNIPQSAGGVKMYRSGGSTQEAGKQATNRSGGSTQEVGKQATYQARIEDPRATNQTLYAYYWFLNGQNKTRGYNQTTFSFAIPQRGTNTVMVRVMKTSDRGKTWQKVGEATDSFEAQGKPAVSNIPPVVGDIRPFVGTWKQPYHGGESTLTINASGSGTISALGTVLTNGQPNKEVGTISRCAVEGQTPKCYWESTYSDGDKTISRGGTITFTLNGNTLTATSTVDRATLKEKWNISPDSYTPGARSGGTGTYTRAQ